MGEIRSGRSSEATRKMRSEDETESGGGAGGCTPGTAHSNNQTLRLGANVNIGQKIRPIIPRHMGLWKGFKTWDHFRTSSPKALTWSQYSPDSEAWVPELNPISTLDQLCDMMQLPNLSGPQFPYR